MTDLQLGLLLVGAAVVAGVVVYNRLQERSARREAEKSFGHRGGDVLAEAAAPRQEPTLEVPATRGPGIQDDALPDSRVDYVINLSIAAGVPGGSVLTEWAALEHRFAKRGVMLAGTDGDGWRRIAAGDAGNFTALQVALQMVSRDGVVPDAELLEFRSQVESLGARIGATAAAPEMRAALDAARGLDSVCADADIQVAVHVVGLSGVDEAALEHAPFHVSPRPDGLSLSIDVPHTLEPGRAYEAMARAAAQLATAHGGRVVDDNGNALDPRALASIASQIESVRHALAERGIEPGSPLAKRLFS